MMRQLGGNQGGFMMSSKGIISSTSRCQDCGNQAKKECAYMRCRTCCKSKGFHCQTHVKSTWIPLYRRRQRQIQQHQHQERQHFHHHHHHDHHDRQGNYPRRLITHNPGSSHQGLELQQEHDGDDDQGQKSNFPAEVTATATFHVVRVSSMADDGAAQYAYQTSVGIGGHVFKGILYDQGPDHHDHHTTTTTTTSSYGGLVAADQVGGLGLMFHQLPSFVNFGSGSSASATTLVRSEANIDYFGANNCSSSSSSSSSSSTVNVVGDQRLLFVGSSSSLSMTCPMFQQSSTTATTTSDFMPAGMQFFPNRKS